MKTVDTALEAELAKSTTTLCRLWRITPHNQVTQYFTDHDRDLTVAGHDYRATTSFQASAVQTTINGAASNVEVTVLLDDGVIGFLDLQRGVYDDAAVELEIISYANLSAPALKIFAGVVKNISEPTKQGAIIAMGGHIGRTYRQLGEIYTPFCRADFGDARCGVDLDPYTEAFTVASAVGGMTFTSTELSGMLENRFALGVVKWLTGVNAGSAQEVALTLTSGQVKLFFRTPYSIEVGDTGEIVQGCPKTVAACVAYNNKPNFRGEPEVPGDSYLGA